LCVGTIFLFCNSISNAASVRFLEGNGCKITKNEMKKMLKQKKSLVEICIVAENIKRIEYNGIIYECKNKNLNKVFVQNKNFHTSHAAHYSSYF